LLLLLLLSRLLPPFPKIPANTTIGPRPNSAAADAIWQ
jgi:hypothetical protein